MKSRTSPTNLACSELHAVGILRGEDEAFAKSRCLFSTAAGSHSRADYQDQGRDRGFRTTSETVAAGNGVHRWRERSHAGAERRAGSAPKRQGTSGQPD